MGSGHSVTALYEVIPAGVTADVDLRVPDSLRYQTPGAHRSPVEEEPRGTAEMLFVKVRYKTPTGATSKLISHPVVAQASPSPSTDFRFQTAVVEFGLLLRQSPFKGDATLGVVIASARAALGSDPDGYRSEFVRLAQAARHLGLPLDERDDGRYGRSRMLRLPTFRYLAPASLADALKWKVEGRSPAGMYVAGGTDLYPNMKRRRKQVPRHGDLGGRHPRAQRPVESQHRRGQHPGRTRRLAPDVTLRHHHGGEVGLDAPSAQHGHDGREPLSRHSLQLLRPDLRVAEGHSLLHEEGWRYLLGGSVLPAVAGP